MKRNWKHSLTQKMRMVVWPTKFETPFGDTHSWIKPCSHGFHRAVARVYQYQGLKTKTEKFAAAQAQESSTFKVSRGFFWQLANSHPNNWVCVAWTKRFWSLSPPVQLHQVMRVALMKTSPPLTEWASLKPYTTLSGLCNDWKVTTNCMTTLLLQLHNLVDVAKRRHSPSSAPEEIFSPSTLWMFPVFFSRFKHDDPSAWKMWSTEVPKYPPKKHTNSKWIPFS